MTGHPAWDTLNDYAEGTLPQAARGELEAHLAACAECEQTLMRLRLVIETAPDLAESVEPPDESWAAIRGTIERGKVVSLPRGATAPRRIAPAPMLAVAAVVLVVASSVVTTLILRRGERPSNGATPNFVAPLPADFAGVERGYLAAARELETSLEDRRAGLSPETARALRGSLEILDAGIAEARQALVRDPGSGALREILAKDYQRKIDLLRRTSARTVGI